VETSTYAPTVTTASSATPVRSTAQSNLYSRLNTEWMYLCARPAAAAEVLTWSVSQDALGEVTDLNDLAAAHRRDRDGVLLALLTLHQEGSSLAGRALLQLMLGKLISLTRHARVSGHDRYHACDERAASTVATFMSLIATYRPSGENVYAALFLHTLKKITREETFAQEIPASDVMGEFDSAENELGADISAPALLTWAVEKKVINDLDRTLIQRAYLEQTDCDLAVIAAEVGMTPAALRQRLYRAVTRIRKSVVASNQPPSRPRFARGRRRTAAATAAI
jgi:hypothetical protein